MPSRLCMNVRLLVFTRDKNATSWRSLPVQEKHPLRARALQACPQPAFSPVIRSCNKMNSHWPLVSDSSLSWCQPCSLGETHPCAGGSCSEMSQSCAVRQACLQCQNAQVIRCLLTLKYKFFWHLQGEGRKFLNIAEKSKNYIFMKPDKNKVSTVLTNFPHSIISPYSRSSTFIYV